MLNALSSVGHFNYKIFLKKVQLENLDFFPGRMRRRSKGSGPYQQYHHLLTSLPFTSPVFWPHRLSSPQTHRGHSQVGRLALAAPHVQNTHLSHPRVA